jgi:putative alpha-1,2-mannosidase
MPSSSSPVPSSALVVDRGRPAFAPADVDADAAEPVWRIVAPSGGGRVRLPALEGAVVSADDELVYDLFPVAGGVDRFAATASAIDLEFDDGTFLSDASPVDQYGSRITAASQADARTAWVDQWNRRVVDVSASAGRRVVSAWVEIGATGEETTVFVNAPTLRARAPRPTEMLEWVDTRRGTRASDRFSRGNNAPIVTLPHGGVFGLPMTDAAAGNWPYRYGAPTPVLQAFATSHIPSPWIGDRGVFQLMPSPLVDPDTDRSARGLAFRHDHETARPDRYEVELEGVSAVLTAARHAIGLRFRSTTDDLSVIVDHLGEVITAEWATDDSGLRLDVRLRDAGQSLDHFVHVITPPVVRCDLEHDGGRLRGSVAFAQNAADVVVGVSTIDAGQARSNAQSAGGVDDMLAEAADRWRAVLARVELDADAVPADVMRSVAGGLARVFSYPNAHDEPGPDGPRYRSPVDGEVRDGVFASNNGFWDTYRTAWPLLGLLTPGTAATLADGFVQHFSDSGWVARWSAPGPVDCMTGTTSDTVFAGLDALGVPLRREEAYRSARRHATVAAADARVGRKGIRPGIFVGHTDTRTHEGLSWTLDNAINDAAAARLARALAPSATGSERERLDTETEYFARRALAYRDVFHRGRGFFIGRDADGRWRSETGAFDPAEWGHDYTETNAWGTAFTAPHDGAGLVECHGGAGAFGAHLDELLATPETADESLSGSYGFVIHEMSEARDVRMGMLALSNQPAHHIPFMYTFVGRHDDTHRLVVEARDRLFVGSDNGQGYPGDEDNGEMSAWYLFAVLGFYPLVPASGEFVLTPPLLPRVVLHPEGRAYPLEITTAGAGAPHIRSVRIDGERWDRIAVPAAVLTSARTVEFELADEPTGWAASTRPSSTSAEFDVAPSRDLLVRVPFSPTDDAGEGIVVLAAGDVVSVDLDGPARVRSYTVTLAGGPAPLPVPADAAVRSSWRLTGITPDGDVVELDRREREEFEVAGETRPFRVSAPAVVVTLRFEALDALDLAQLEAFD